MLTIQGIFERRARDKLVRRKTAVRSPVEKPIMIFAMSDLIKISVNPTSEKNHQSVIRETILEKKIKPTNTSSKNVQEKNLMIFIQKTDLLSWPVIINDVSLL